MAQIAGLLCASADLDGLPYALAPMPGCAGLDEVLDGSLVAGHNLPAVIGGPPGLAPGTQLPPSRARDADISPPAWQFHASSRLVAALARPPAREVPGIRFVLRPDFDVTPETAVIPDVAWAASSDPAVPVGTVLDWNRVPPAGINPLEPAPGPDDTRFPLQTHADLVRALFLAAFEADEPFPQVLAADLTRCYENAGWDLVTGEPATPGARPGYPALEDLQATALQVVEEIGYGREITDNVRGFVQVRISSPWPPPACGWRHGLPPPRVIGTSPGWRADPRSAGWAGHWLPPTAPRVTSPAVPPSLLTADQPGSGGRMIRGNFGLTADAGGTHGPGSGHYLLCPGTHQGIVRDSREHGSGNDGCGGNGISENDGSCVG
jgi:hypothetical protein